MTEKEEAAYLAGQRAVYLEQFRSAARKLDPQGASGAEAVAEVESARQALVNLCLEFKIDPPPADLHLADVIEKYIRPCFIGADDE